MKKTILIITLIFIMIFVSCGKKDNNAEIDQKLNGENTISENEKTDKNQNDNSGNTKNQVKKIYNNEKDFTLYSPKDSDTYPKITWAIDNDFSLKMSDEIVSHINSILHENGIEYSLQILVTDNSQEGFSSNSLAPFNYFDKLDYYETKNGNVIDIISGSGGYTQQSSAMILKSGRYLKLNDILSSDEGKEVFELFDEKDWKAVSVDGDYYSIPLESGYIMDYSCNICFNKKYIDDISDFDGSFAKLVELYEKAGSKGSIVFEYNDGVQYTNSFKLWNGLAYNKSENCFYDTLALEETQSNLQLVEIAYDDGKGYLKINTTREEVGDDNIFAIMVFHDVLDYQDNYLCYEYNTNAVEKKCHFSTGISSKSINADAAFEILKLVYTNRELADTLLYGMEEEDYLKENGKIKPVDLNSEELHYWEFGNNFYFNTYFFATPLITDATEDRYQDYLDIMQGYTTDFWTEFTPELTFDECKLLDLYSVAVDNYFYSYVENQPFPENNLGISSYEDLQIAMEPVITKLNEAIK